MDNFEKLVESIMREYEKDGEPITRQEAEEIAEIEQNVQKMPRKYEKSGGKAEKKPKKPKIMKISQEKQALFSEIHSNLTNIYENVQVLKENKLISVQIGEKTFKIDIIEQRPPK